MTRCSVRADPQMLSVEAQCRLEVHPHRQAHYACGEVEGVRWTMFWWALGADPDAPADPKAA